MTPDFEIIMPADERVGLLFNTLALRKYSERLGIELEDLYEGLKNIAVEQKDDKAFKRKHLPELILSAHQSYCVYAKLPFSSTVEDACMWVDAAGGPISATALSIYAVCFARMVNADPNQVEVTAKTEEKKSTETALPGIKSESSQ